MRRMVTGGPTQFIAQAEFRRQRPDAADTEKDDWMHENLLAIPTWQPSSQDLSEISDKASRLSPPPTERLFGLAPPCSSLL